jgi:hypothetical protein
MHRLAKAHRSTRNDHLHRNARLGSRRSAAMTLGIRARSVGKDAWARRGEFEERYSREEEDFESAIVHCSKLLSIQCLAIDVTTRL